MTIGLNYHSITDVQRLLQVTFSANTEATIDDVTQIMLETETNDIDSKLAGVYATPVTGARALLVMQSIAAKISAGKVAEIYGYNYRRAADKEIGEKVPSLLAQGYRELNDLVVGKKTLIFDNDPTNSAQLLIANRRVASSFGSGRGEVKHSRATDFGPTKDEDRY